MSNREAMELEAWGDLRKFLEFAEEMGNVEYVDGADPQLEIGALYEISLEEPAPPVLLFRNMKGCAADQRVVVNIRLSKVFDSGATGLELVQRLSQAPPQEDRADPAASGQRRPGA